MSLLETLFFNLGNPAFWSGLASIIVIDLVLAGDNAIVIALAARNLPKLHQFRAIFWGTIGAIVVRVLLTFAVIWLLKLPGLMLAGGVLLVPIALKLLGQQDASAHSTRPASGFWGAILTIMVADALMGLDNVLAIAGASGGHMGLVVLGLLISIPLVVWGSTLLLKLIERFPVIVYIGAAAIAWTAARMIGHDHLVKDWFDTHTGSRYVLDALLILGVIGVGRMLRKRAPKAA